MVVNGARGVDRSALTFAVIGGVLIAIATVMIWGARFSLHKNSYVSGLGSTGEVTAPVFNAALLMVAVGGLSLAISMRRAGVAGGVAGGAVIAPWVLIAASSVCFFTASQVTCTYECPIPGSAAFTVQDAVHIIVAVLGFALACIAMGVAALRSPVRIVRAGSWTAGGLVALVAGAGGLLSLAEIGVQVGSWLEFVAMTVALAWLVWYGFAEVLAPEQSARGRAPVLSVARRPAVQLVDQ
ncbi:DUF998 domain-containing protein [Plantibacter sp. Mn2098]|uniref:DUF998 domain-containing protein n=1 Tax=Plantibacter sp. Mn2098 TaxID=3395266 RepID=UPI003BC4150B